MHIKKHIQLHINTEQTVNANINEKTSKYKFLYINTIRSNKNQMNTFQNIFRMCE